MTRLYPFQRTARWLSLGFLAVALLLGGWTTSWAQEDKQEEDKTPPRLRATPGDDGMGNIKRRDFPQLKVVRTAPPRKGFEVFSPHHEMLHKLAGNWAATARIHTGPDAEPVETRGAAKSELVVGGRALQTEYKGTFMDEPFFRLGLHGYDMDKEQHFSFMMDTTATGASMITGECSHEGMDVVTMHGEFTDPETGQDVERTTILTVRSTSRYTFEEWHKRGEAEPVLAAQIIFSKR